MRRDRKAALGDLEARLRERLAQLNGVSGEDVEVGVLADEARQIVAALNLASASSYGMCVDCERDIPLARLQARPQAIRCITCQERHEQRMILRRRAPPAHV